jgi:hypothetical protein
VGKLLVRRLGTGCAELACETDEVGGGAAAGAGGVGSAGRTSWPMGGAGATSSTVSAQPAAVAATARILTVWSARGFIDASRGGSEAR